MIKPEHRAHENWPKCSFFGVYDGHGKYGRMMAELASSKVSERFEVLMKKSVKILN